MSVIQSFHELWPRERIREFAFANPALPRVIGVDVGQAKLALWFGAPAPDARAESAGSLRFTYFGWILIHCDSTTTNAQAIDIVTRALEHYAEHPFQYASDVVIEKQHKKNGRMKALASAIQRFFRQRVPNGARMRISQRQALFKFANITALPCPMPREYVDRKEAAFAAVAAQTRQWAGERWRRFLEMHAGSERDLSDAALIGQDYMIAHYLVHLVKTHRIAEVSGQLAVRRQRNTFHKKASSSGHRKYDQVYTAADAFSFSVSNNDPVSSSDDDDAANITSDTSHRHKRHRHADAGVSSNSLMGLTMNQLLSKQK